MVLPITADLVGKHLVITDTGQSALRYTGLCLAVEYGHLGLHFYASTVLSPGRPTYGVVLWRAADFPNYVVAETSPQAFTPDAASALSQLLRQAAKRRLLSHPDLRQYRKDLP